MNEIAKKSASERLVKAMDHEKLGPSEVGRKLGLLPQYITMAKQEKFWPKMPRSAWDRILHWVNSGETIHHYKPPIELAPKEISRKPAEVKPEVIESNIPNIKEVAKEAGYNLIRKAVDKSIEIQREAEAGNPEPILSLDNVLNAIKVNPAHHLADTNTRLKISLDIEINFIVNGQKINMK